MKTSLFKSSSRRLVIGNTGFRLLSHHYSTSPTPNTSGFHPQSRRHEEESRNVRVFVWWDFENCSIPVGSNVYKVSQRITAAIRTHGIKGPVQITAFGDVVQLSRYSQEALTATGVILTHIPRGGKNSADRSLLVDLMYWVTQNPPPAHLFLISGDRDFASILHRLRMNNYNILLASQDSAHGVLCSAASIMWEWSSLVKGKIFTGKHFNQPPDGPNGSWYGHYRVPIEDPFLVSEQPGCLQSELSESDSDCKPRSVPKTVVKMISNILNLNPQGISITELRAELDKHNLTIPKDFYGYRNFSRVLLSMPHILTLQPDANGQHFLRGIVPKISELGESSLPINPGFVTSNTGSSTVSSKKNGGDMSSKINERDMSCKEAGPTNNTEDLVSTISSKKTGGDMSSKINGRDMSCKGAGSTTSTVDLVSTNSSKKPGGDMSCKGAGNEKSSLPSSTKSNMKNPIAELQERLKEVKETRKQVPDSSSVVEKVSNGELIASRLYPAEESCPTPEGGFLKRIWSKWFSGKEDAEVKRHDNIEKCYKPRDNTKKIEQEITCVESTGTSPSDPVGLSAPSSSSQKAGPTSSSSSSNEIVMDKYINSSSEVNDDKSIEHPGIFSRILSWCKFRRSDQNTENLNEEFRGKNTERSIDLEMREVFSESLWNDMLTFLKTPKGSDSILQSRTRKEMVQNLQKQGPASLLSLSEHHLLHLVDLLVLDKHWVEESPAQAFPFKLILPAGKSSWDSPGSTKELSSISDPQSKLGSQLEQPENDGEKRCHNLPHGGVLSGVIPNKSSNKSRIQVLGDCQKLTNELLKKHPDGYNMGIFRKLFLERYGYSLDVRELGYPKLVALLQIIPGVKIESSYVLPSGRVWKSSSTEVADPTVIQGSSNKGKKDPKSDRKSSRKDDDDPDSPWGELGPVTANSSPKSNDEMEGSSRRVKEESAGPQMLHDYETVSHDDDCFSDSDSDSEDEMLSTTGGSKGQGKPREDEVDNSSLLQILDSWYCTKEDSRRKIAASASAFASASASESAEPSSLSGISIKKENSVEVFGRKPRAPRTYSFVTDESGDNKDKLIDGIIGSLKKSGDGLSESRI